MPLFHPLLGSILLLVWITQHPSTGKLATHSWLSPDAQSGLKHHTYQPKRSHKKKKIGAGNMQASCKNTGGAEIGQMAGPLTRSAEDSQESIGINNELEKWGREGPWCPQKPGLLPQREPWTDLVGLMWNFWTWVKTFKALRSKRGHIAPFWFGKMWIGWSRSPGTVLPQGLGQWCLAPKDPAGPYGDLLICAVTQKAWNKKNHSVRRMKL